MNNKKRVAVVMLVLIISIIGVSLVSAGWLRDLFGQDSDLEGELADVRPTVVYANVTPSGNAPRIILVEPPYDPLTGDYVNLDLVGSDGTGGITTVNFSFLVTEDPFGTGNAPGGKSSLPGVNPGLDVTASVLGNFTSPGETTRVILTTPSACVYIGENAGAGDRYNGYDWKNYTCSVNVSWYDIPAPDNWTISVQFILANNWSEVNDTTLFSHARIYGMAIIPESVNFTLTPNLGNTEADNDVLVENLGNVDINYGGDHQLIINASSLWNITSLLPEPNEKSISASNFTANALGTGFYCNMAAGGLFTELEYSYIEVTVPRMVWGLNDNTTGFCAVTVPDVPGGFYKATLDWIVENCNGVGCP